MSTECNKTKEELIFDAAVKIYTSKTYSGYNSEKNLISSVEEAKKIYELIFKEQN